MISGRKTAQLWRPLAFYCPDCGAGPLEPCKLDHWRHYEVYRNHLGRRRRARRYERALEELARL